MENRKMIITHDIEANLLAEIQELVPQWNIIAQRNPDAWLAHLNSAEIIVGWKKEISEALNSDSPLRWVQSWSAGVNSMPLKKMEEMNVILTSANGVHAYPISETIFALMLALTRNIHMYVKNQLNRKWHHSGLKLELHGKTIGIIGVGAIGLETAKIAKAFGMEVIGIRHSGNPEKNVDEMYLPKQLDEVLPRCDYVVVTLPLTSETSGLFGKEQFALMKTTSIFINIGRGAIVKENELISALSNGEIAGAGLDVFEKEPLNEDNPLWDMDNVIITPHTAGSTEHYAKRVLQDIFIPNLKAYCDGKVPSINLVDYKKGY
ncbi:2-hydroxyacid dehydrogenase [Mesobacillus campisalis]|uniref:2-hydroxyacid dehydrogenase n=1 Tax=Mesobacillus campisalis TaxID=1408103 RepID=A0A0M2SSS1_9BACI|nr:D-2-hydroxyacid dehydrogenase [Mesobacillus campisalis]KKK37188.1 2-hydroxyacid dehydrogenase [Mesobacillus campisalis]